MARKRRHSRWLAEKEKEEERGACWRREGKKGEDARVWPRIKREEEKGRRSMCGG
jgi:hypothetical protein